MQGYELVVSNGKDARTVEHAPCWDFGAGTGFHSDDSRHDLIPGRRLSLARMMIDDPRTTHPNKEKLVTPPECPFQYRRPILSPYATNSFWLWTGVACSDGNEAVLP